jgi:hypothetical protein
MIELFGYSLALFIGFSLGLVGGGGSILVIPVLVFFFKIDPSFATSYSLFIVGISAFCGSITQVKNRNVEYKAVFQFGIPSVIALLIVRKWLLPRIPEIVYHSGGVMISKALLIMVVFSILMIVVGLTMIRQKKYERINGDLRRPRLFVQGLLTGAVTGFIGIGGGFIIVPSLVLFAGLPMRRAIGTSLAIITINCIVGLLSNWNLLSSLHYPFLFRFAFLSILGMLLGSWFIKLIPDKQLKPIFGWIILAMSAFVVMRIFLRY